MRFEFLCFYSLYYMQIYRLFELNLSLKMFYSNFTKWWNYTENDIFLVISNEEFMTKYWQIFEKSYIKMFSGMYAIEIWSLFWVKTQSQWCELWILWITQKWQSLKYFDIFNINYIYIIFGLNPSLLLWNWIMKSFIEKYKLLIKFNYVKCCFSVCVFSQNYQLIPS